MKLRSSLERIIFLLIAAGMILGLYYSAACDESYDAVRGLGEYRNEISAPAVHDAADLIADRSADAHQSRFLTERDKTGRQLLAGPRAGCRSKLAEIPQNKNYVKFWLAEKLVISPNLADIAHIA